MGCHQRWRLEQVDRQRAQLGGGLEETQTPLHAFDLLPDPRELALDREYVLKLARPSAQQLYQPVFQTAAVLDPGGQIDELFADILCTDVDELQPAEWLQSRGEIIEPV
jgi:hypothetical protein